MTIYDYSDLLKMIANINTDKIIAKNERTMNNNFRRNKRNYSKWNYGIKRKKWRICSNKAARLNKNII